MIQLTVDAVHKDYAVLTGIQIHGPQGMEYVWPGEIYWVREGNRHGAVLN